MCSAVERIIPVLAKGKEKQHSRNWSQGEFCFAGFIYPLTRDGMQYNHPRVLSLHVVLHREPIRECSIKPNKTQHFSHIVV